MATFPNALSTMWCYVTDDQDKANDMLANTLVPVIKRKESELRGRVLVGSSETCAAILRAYRDAGLQRVLIWPIAEEMEQLRVFKEKVIPLV